MKNRIFGVMALAFSLAVVGVGVDALANQAQAAEMKVDHKLQDCAKACSDCQRVCDLCATHCANLLADCCAKCCDHCAKACEAFPDDKHIRECAEECRKCEKACKAIAK